MSADTLTGRRYVGGIEGLRGPQTIHSYRELSITSRVRPRPTEKLHLAAEWTNSTKHGSYECVKRLFSNTYVIVIDFNVEHHVGKPPIVGLHT